jgi:hypothetical protein
VLRQTPLQSACPAAQAQAPLAQVVPMGQALPQPPQFALLLFTSVQTPPQSAWPVGHDMVTRQVPPMQLCPVGQALPQAPQLRASVAVSAQVPAQFC